MTAIRKVIVIGAGISGLCAAYRLKQRGYQVRVLEKSSGPGGVIRSERVNGFLLEAGPNSFRETEELTTLVSELKLESEALRGDPAAPRYVWRNNSLIPVPMGPGSLISTRLISNRAKLRLLAEPFIKQRVATGEESIADFITRRLGREIHDALVAPFVSGVYAGDSRQLSLQASFPKLAELEGDGGSIFRGGIKAIKRTKAERKVSNAPRRRMTLFSFKDGLGELSKALAVELGSSIECDCGEIAITRKTDIESTFEIGYSRDGQRQRLTADVVVIAAPAYAAADLVRSMAEDKAAALAGIPYAPVVIAYAGCAEHHIPRSLNGFGYLVPRSEGLKTLGCIWNSSLFPGRAPGGMHLMTLFLGGSTDPARIDASDDEIRNTVNLELQTTLQLKSPAEILRIVRWRRAIPQYTFGHNSRVNAIEASNNLPGLFFTGNYLHGVSGGDCVSQANLTAERVESYFAEADIKR